MKSPIGPMREIASRVVDLVYRSLMEPDAWQSMLDALSSLVPGGQGVMLYHDTAMARGAFSLTSGFDPEAIARYDRHYNALNPWMPGAAVRPLGLGVRAEQMLPRTALLRTEFHADWLQPQGLSTGIGLTVLRQNGRVFLISVIGVEGDEQRWTTGADILTAISPHIERVVRLLRDAAPAALAKDAGMALAGSIGGAVVAVGAERQPIWMNEAAQRRGGSDHGLRFLPNGSVRLADAAADDLLGRMLGEAPGLGGVPRAASFSGRTPSGRFTRLSLANACRSKFEFHLRGPTVFVMQSEQRMTRAAIAGEMRRRFALTPRETEIATAISEGSSVEAIATRLGLSRETVRIHVKAVFAKMGLSRQAEVAAAFLSLATEEDGEA